jgi:hypothetical protein
MSRRVTLYRPIVPDEGSAYMAQVEATDMGRTYVLTPSLDLTQPEQLRSLMDFANYRIMPKAACATLFVAESAIDAANLALEFHKQHEEALAKQLVVARRRITEVAILGMASAGIGATLGGP